MELWKGKEVQNIVLISNGDLKFFAGQNEKKATDEIQNYQTYLNF